MTLNRKQRRAGGKRIILIDIGRLLPNDPNHGETLGCWLCAATHAASGVARIQDHKSVSHVPLCDGCVTADDVTDRIGRKHLNTPDLVISAGGKLTTEQLIALRDKHNETEH